MNDLDLLRRETENVGYPIPPQMVDRVLAQP